jgi:hypothetical protein
MIASDDPPLPSGLRSDLPMGLEQAVLACLEKKPEKRSSLVDLARLLAQHVPGRALASLERIEAVAAPGEPRSRAPTLAEGASAPRRSRVSSMHDGRSPSRAALPGVGSPTSGASELPASGVERARTQATWSDVDARKRGRAGRWPLFALVVVAAGVFAVGVYTGGIRMSALRGRVASATSAVASAVESALPTSTGTASHHAPAASSKPPTPPSATPPSPSASAAPAASDEPDEEEDEDPEAVASALASAIAPYLAPYAGPAPGLTPPPAPPHSGVPPAPATPASSGSSSAKKHNPKHHKTWKKHH